MVKDNGKKVIKRSIFVEVDDYDIFIRYAEHTNRSISSLFRDAMKTYAYKYRRDLAKQQESAGQETDQAPIKDNV